MTDPKKTTLTLLIAALLSLGAVAIPVTAQDDNSTEEEDGADGGAGGPPEDRGRPDHAGPSGSGDADADDDGNDTRRGGPPADHPGRERAAQALDDAHARCVEHTNGSERCEKIQDAKSHAMQARRAVHACLNAEDAWEHRITLLELKEKRVRDALGEGNLSANETAAFEAQIERIQSMQDKFLDKMESCQERVAGLADRFEEARAYAHGRERVEVCHTDDETNETVTLRIAGPALEAHLRHGDSEGACPDDALADESGSDDNSTADDNRTADDNSTTDGNSTEDGSDGSDGTDGSDGSDTNSTSDGEDGNSTSDGGDGADGGDGGTDGSDGGATDGGDGADGNSTGDA